MKNERRIAPAGVRFLVALVALGAICAGCASMPTGRFDTLVAASKGVETSTAQTDADLVKLTRRFMMFSPAPGPYRVDSFAPVVEVGGARLDFDFGPRLEPRQAALGVLAAYTEVLAAFARKDYGASWTKRRTRSVEASSGWRVTSRRRRPPSKAPASWRRPRTASVT